MELFLRITGRGFLAGLRATSKATMCPEINRYEDYGPLPKTDPMLIVVGRSGESKSRACWNITFWKRNTRSTSRDAVLPGKRKNRERENRSRSDWTVRD
jgi:hypothetical protein